MGDGLTLHTWERQELLGAASIDDRLHALDRLLRRELALLIHTGVIGNTVDFPGRNISLN